MSVELILTLTAVFATVALVSGSVTSFALARNAPERRRLRRLTTAAPVTARVEKLQLAELESSALSKITRMLPSGGGDPIRLRRRLALGGYDTPAAAAVYSLSQVVLPIVCGALPLLVLGLRAGWAVAAVAAGIGYLLPDLVLSHQTTKHKKAIQDGLPDALDMIVVCVEAGSSLDQAILKASTELEISLPAIARELKMVATETRAGKPRLESFQDLAHRTGVDDVKALVATLIQTDRFGTSIAQSLRTHAETSRTKRRQRAEERASTIGVKLVFPLVLCLIPALYVVCLGPVLVAMYRQLL